MKLNGCVISTFRCNARCHMCNIWQNPTKKEDEITLDIVEKLPDNMGRVNLTGGEPMLREDIEDLVKILYMKADLVEISTNGYFTDKIVAIAEKYPKVMIRVSIEGLPALNDKLRGIPNGFDHALRTVLELKKTPVKNFGFSVVMCDKNAGDFTALYDLCSSLDVELSNATMHNSWYFHKYDNVDKDKDRVLAAERQFIKQLLQSRRRNIKLRAKDWLRAYFNLNILSHIDGKANLLEDCCAGKDMFFLDPAGNILPCNGTEERWIMGNLKNNSFQEIWDSSEAESVRKQVSECNRECAFIGTARFDMKRRPWKPVFWIAKNKARVALDKEIDYCETA